MKAQEEFPELDQVDLAFSLDSINTLTPSQLVLSFLNPFWSNLIEPILLKRWRQLRELRRAEIDHTLLIDCVGSALDPFPDFELLQYRQFSLEDDIESFTLAQLLLVRWSPYLPRDNISRDKMIARATDEFMRRRELRFISIKSKDQSTLEQPVVVRKAATEREPRSRRLSPPSSSRHSPSRRSSSNSRKRETGRRNYDTTERHREKRRSRSRSRSRSPERRRERSRRSRSPSRERRTRRRSDSRTRVRRGHRSGRTRSESRSRSRSPPRKREANSRLDLSPTITASSFPSVEISTTELLYASVVNSALISSLFELFVSGIAATATPLDVHTSFGGSSSGLMGVRLSNKPHVVHQNVWGTLAFNNESSRDKFIRKFNGCTFPTEVTKLFMEVRNMEYEWKWNQMTDAFILQYGPSELIEETNRRNRVGEDSVWDRNEHLNTTKMPESVLIQRSGSGGSRKSKVDVGQLPTWKSITAPLPSEPFFRESTPPSLSFGSTEERLGGQKVISFDEIVEEEEDRKPFRIRLVQSRSNREVGSVVAVSSSSSGVASKGSAVKNVVRGNRIIKSEPK